MCNKGDGWFRPEHVFDQGVWNPGVFDLLILTGKCQSVVVYGFTRVYKYLDLKIIDSIGCFSVCV